MLQDEFFRNVPPHYPEMHLDGYTPEEIMYAFRKSFREDCQIDQEQMEILKDAIVEEIRKQLTKK